MPKMCRKQEAGAIVKFEFQKRVFFFLLGKHGREGCMQKEVATHGGGLLVLFDGGYPCLEGF